VAHIFRAFLAVIKECRSSHSQKQQNMCLVFSFFKDVFGSPVVMIRIWGSSVVHSCVLLLWKGGEGVEIVPTPGEVVLGKDKLLVMSPGAGSSTCRRSKIEE